MNESNAPQSQDSTAKDANQSKNKGSGGEVVAASPKHIPTTNKNDEAKTQKESTMWSWFRKQITVALVIEILIFAVTIKIAYIYSGQLDEMIKSNKISRESLVTVQRAFMNMYNVQNDRTYKREADGVDTPGYSFSISTDNSGTTQALRIASSMNANLLSGEPDEKTFLGDNQALRISALGPKQQRLFGPVFRADEVIFGRRLPDKFDPKTWRTEKMPGRHFVVWGWVVYSDIFPGTNRHVSEFCDELQNVGYNNSSSMYVLSWAGCRSHNCTDDTCEDYAEVIAAASAK